MLICVKKLHNLQMLSVNGFIKQRIYISLLKSQKSRWIGKSILGTGQSKKNERFVRMLISITAQ